MSRNRSRAISVRHATAAAVDVLKEEEHAVRILLFV